MMVSREAGFFSHEEAEAHANARAQFVEWQRLRLRELREGCGEVSGRKVVIGHAALGHCSRQFVEAVPNGAQEAGIVDTQSGNNAQQDELQDPSFGGSLFQYLKLLVVHRVLRVRPRQQHSQPADSSKSKKEA